MTHPPKDDLPTALLRERDRVRDVVAPAYEALGVVGTPALLITIRPTLEFAERALKEHNAAAMVVAFAALKGIKL